MKLRFRINQQKNDLFRLKLVSLEKRYQKLYLTNRKEKKQTAWFNKIIQSVKNMSFLKIALKPVYLK